MKSLINVAGTGLLLLSSCAFATDDAGFSQGKNFEEVSGDELYHAICQGCHMPDAQGAKGAGAYPALANNPTCPI